MVTGGRAEPSRRMLETWISSSLVRGATSSSDQSSVGLTRASLSGDLAQRRRGPEGSGASAILPSSARPRAALARRSANRHARSGRRSRRGKVERPTSATSMNQPPRMAAPRNSSASTTMTNLRRSHAGVQPVRRTYHRRRMAHSDALEMARSPVRSDPRVEPMTSTDTANDTATGTEADRVTVPVRLDVDAHAAAFSKAMSHVDNVATAQLDKVGIDPGLRDLLRLRASQLNGCAYCVDTHHHDARAAGESEQRVASVAVWKESPFFTARERAAFAFPES